MSQNYFNNGGYHRQSRHLRVDDYGPSGSSRIGTTRKSDSSILRENSDYLLWDRQIVKEISNYPIVAQEFRSKKRTEVKLPMMIKLPMMKLCNPDMVQLVHEQYEELLELHARFTKNDTMQEELLPNGYKNDQEDDETATETGEIDRKLEKIAISIGKSPIPNRRISLNMSKNVLNSPSPSNIIYDLESEQNAKKAGRPKRGSKEKKVDSDGQKSSSASSEPTTISEEDEKKFEEEIKRNKPTIDMEVLKLETATVSLWQKRIENAAKRIEDTIRERAEVWKYITTEKIDISVMKRIETHPYFEEASNPADPLCLRFILQDIFILHGNNSIEYLTLQLNKLRQENNFDDYLASFRDIVNSLTMLDYRPSNDMLVTNFLAGLKSEFEGIKNEIRACRKPYQDIEEVIALSLIHI